MRPKEIRIARGYSRGRMAAWSGMTETTVRIYEIDPNEIAPDKRAQLDRLYDTMRTELRAALTGN